MAWRWLQFASISRPLRGEEGERRKSGEGEEKRRVLIGTLFAASFRRKKERGEKGEEKGAPKTCFLWPCRSVVSKEGGKEKGGRQAADFGDHLTLPISSSGGGGRGGGKEGKEGKKCTARNVLAVFRSCPTLSEGEKGGEYMARANAAAVVWLAERGRGKKRRIQACLGESYDSFHFRRKGRGGGGGGGGGIEFSGLDCHKALTPIRGEGGGGRGGKKGKKEWRPRKNLVHSPLLFCRGEGGGKKGRWGKEPLCLPIHHPALKWGKRKEKGGEGGRSSSKQD